MFVCMYMKWGKETISNTYGLGQLTVFDGPSHMTLLYPGTSGHAFWSLFPSISSVVDLLYWRDIKKTGVVFGASLFLLLSLTVFSIVSVIAYIALGLLSVTINFRIYKGVIQAIQKSDEGHPFR